MPCVESTRRYTDSSVVTSDFVYLRLIGDRSIQEKDFGSIQIDRIKEMKKVARNFKDDTNEGELSDVKLAIVAANNHYAGFGPGTVNIFRQLLGLKEVEWADEYLVSEDLRKDDDVGMDKRLMKTKQTRLSDCFALLFMHTHGNPCQTFSNKY